MSTTEKTKITVATTVNAPVEKVWTLWNEPAHIVKWNTATPEWHTPRADQDLRTGGKFNFRMEAKDGSFGFDFAGVYDLVTPNERIEYTMGDGRTAQISFTQKGDQTHISTTFDAESMNPIEMQRDGWQAITDNFKKYAESIG